MLNRFIYDYIYQNKIIILIYMGYKQKIRKIKKDQIKKYEEKKKILSEWVVVDRNVIKSKSRVLF
jgi:phage regulator Rha-like protein